MVNIFNQKGGIILSRIFIGIPIVESVGSQLLAQAESQFKLSQDQLYPLSKLHLTVAFIGEMSADQLETLHVKLTTLWVKQSTFNLQFKKFDCLKPRNRDALLLALTDLSLDLGKLVYQVKQILLALDLPTDKRVFRPHVTLSRKIQHSMSVECKLHMVQSVTELVVYQSENGRYTPLYRYPLQSMA